MQERQPYNSHQRSQGPQICFHPCVGTKKSSPLPVGHFSFLRCDAAAATAAVVGGVSSVTHACFFVSPQFHNGVSLKRTKTGVRMDVTSFRFSCWKHLWVCECVVFGNNYVNFGAAVAGSAAYSRDASGSAACNTTTSFGGTTEFRCSVGSACEK